jgi:transposase
LIALHKVNRKKIQKQEGRKLRRYKRRLKIELFFAWLQNFRRIVVRHKYHAENFPSIFQLGCAIILLRNFEDGL